MMNISIYLVEVTLHRAPHSFGLHRILVKSEHHQAFQPAKYSSVRLCLCFAEYCALPFSRLMSLRHLKGLQGGL